MELKTISSIMSNARDGIIIISMREREQGGRGLEEDARARGKGRHSRRGR